MKKIINKNFKTLLPVINAILIGLQWMIAAFLIVGLHPRPRQLDLLTDLGKYWYRPEYDLLIYICGCFVVLLLIFIFTRIEQKLHFTYSLLSCVIQLILVVFFKNFILDFWKQPVNYNLKVLLTMIWAFILVFPSMLAVYFSVKNTRWKFPFSSRLNMNLIDLIFPLLIILLIYIPDMKNLSGKIYLNDQFLHWNSFAIRPALGFRHGLTLGKEMFVQYGLGWPVVMSLLNPPDLTYSSMIHVGIIYAGIYYIGLYILLRLLTRDIFWSITGTCLTLLFQFFTRNFPLPFFWETPSSTILRMPFDVWFFSAVVLAINSGFTFWKIVAAIFTGLAILFEFDTGIYLAFTFGFYLVVPIINAVINKKYQTVKKEIYISLLCIFTVCIILFGSMAFVVKVSVLDIKYWSVLIEGIKEYGGGITSLPLATLRSNSSLIVFELIIGMYLFVVGNWLIKFLNKKSHSEDMFAAGLGFYGLVMLLIFIGRSHILNLMYPTVPFWILFTWVVVKIYKLMSVHYKQIQSYIPAISVITVGILLLTNPAYQNYSNILNSYFKGSDKNEICLFQDHNDVCGLPETERKTAIDFTDITTKMKTWQSRGKTVAVFDDYDTRYYLAINSYPKFRYTPYDIFTKKQLEYISQQIINKQPDYILIRKDAPKNDIMTETQRLINSYYQQEKDLSIFNVWQKNN